MAIKPILFNTEMVRAILDGRKTCTRKIMSFKEFVRWCNGRACDGCWGMNEAITCIGIMNEVTKKPFWKREKYWKEKFEGYALNLIVNPIEKMIAEMEESHDGE